ncbi:MAG: hypothetical protein KKE44_20895 [Proteobacteria bacterium]|nr:hypothetical protein [Pseudomonadota bacterium]MBU1585190.1 hypothetical protein [Pseudomonadota bacterium]MBU2431832.1 hypothetical protein [Pseudomonadota bacterium]MBU2454503.1 hypothetical protein [Pseudomonadota bacterium]MBU2629080.1 hypothetical protein [Pseudomonadota bacterium]
MFDLSLPDFEIIVWIKNNDFGKKFEKEILVTIKDLEIDDYSETKDTIVYQWIVPSWIQTMVIGGQLKDFIGNPNLIFLKLKANNDSNIQDVTLKDDRKYKKL